MRQRKLLTVIMDGVGERTSSFGNAVKIAYTPNLNFLRDDSLFTTLKAHGKAVGLPSDADMGNSEVGHNALGAGRVFDQGAKLVFEAIDSGSLFEGECWKKVVNNVKNNHSVLHFIGLLSDGNVHSHEQNLYKLLEAAKLVGVNKVRVHVLLDGRDVSEKSAEIYIDRLEKKMCELSSPTFDIKVASGGGRMMVTMDRYEADWDIVKRGWDAHVRGVAPYSFSTISEAIKTFREDSHLSDQNIPPFVIIENSIPVGRISNGDSVVLFNFRGDRAIEISRAFSDEDFTKFNREEFPKVFYAGMMEYDGDLQIPPNYLVSPPVINNTLSEYLVENGLRQFACSETQKFGHVTYFWNGNRSGKFSEKLEEYFEVPSDKIDFQFKPWMKAVEITEETIKRIISGKFDFLRINFPNGDMVGHTGSFEASVIAMSTVDLMIGRLIDVCKKTGTILMITADHGNCDEMFDVKDDVSSGWLGKPQDKLPKPKTSHTLSPVPFYLFDPVSPLQWRLVEGTERSIANIASTITEILGLAYKENYLQSLVSKNG